jgi:hypothetical protein
MSTATIDLTTYLGSWGFVVSIIVVRFIVDQRSFLLESLPWIDNNTFLFQQHLKATCDLLPPPIRACLPSFEQFIGQQMVQLQDSILEHLHHHTFSSMLFDEIFEAHCAQILLCFGLRADVCLTIWLTSLIFSIVLQIWLGLPHPSIASIPHACAHIPLTLWVSTYYVVLMATNA